MTPKSIFRSAVTAITLAATSIGRSLPSRMVRAAYTAAVSTRLNADWPMHILSADAAARFNLRQLRARSRDLERNCPLAERYFLALEANVLGAGGIGLQMKVMNAPGKDGVALPDDIANDIIEAEWKAFRKKGNIDVTGEHSGHSFDRTVLRSASRDADVFIRKLRGKQWGTWGIKFQIIEGDYVDEQYNETLANGNQVRMGIEVDQWKRKVAYWVLSAHPGDTYDGVYYYDGKRTRIPASEIIHVVRTKRAEQTRDVPWLTPAMEDIKMLDGYEQAVIVGARAGACKMGIWEREFPDDYDGDFKDANGNPLTETEPGAVEIGPMGYKWKTHDPSQPMAEYPSFVKQRVRRIASAVGMSYVALGNDLESVNYSSIRAGVLDEREFYKMTQTWYVECVEGPMFEEWLFCSLMIGKIKLPMERFEKFNSPEWQPRRWPWVDPLKDIQATKEAINGGLETRSNVCAEQNRDWQEIARELAEEKKIAEAFGLDFSESTTVASADAAVPEGKSGGKVPQKED